MMSRVRSNGGIGLAFALLTSMGCDSGEESIRVKECRNVCEKRNMCLSTTDLADCEMRCDEQVFRSDLYYQLKAQCVGDGRLSCDWWADELDERGEDLCLGEGCDLDQCVHRKLLEHELSEEQQEYCTELSNDLYACERTLNADSLAATCARTLLEVSSEYAEETEKCVNLRCMDGTEFRRCFDDLNLKYGTQIRIFGI